MQIGYWINVIQQIVLVTGGIILVVQPARMRWRGIWAKLLFTAIVLGIIGMDVLNLNYGKYSATMIMAISIIMFAILFIFFNIGIWQLMAHHFIYWFTVMLVSNMMIHASAFFQQCTFYQYINYRFDKPYSYIHYMGMAGMIFGVIMLIYIRRGRPLITCYSKRGYQRLLFVVAGECMIDMFCFSNKAASNRQGSINLMVMLLILWLLLSLILIFTVLKLYGDSKNQQIITSLDRNRMKEQLQLVQESYDDKRRQIHDTRNQEIIVMEMLEDGAYEQAKEYLSKRMEKLGRKQKHRYTGISSLDVLLDYKIRKAEQSNIRMRVDASVYGRLIEETDICVILGNLLDNAIEAVMDLPSEKRYIDIKMDTPNCMLIIDISNPYAGKRKKRDGHYVTSKEDKEMHGLGLSSVEKIVHSYNGEVEIMDSGQIFQVVVSIYNREISNT